jgi:putative tricarboxylic transport membrane protein
VKGRLRQVLPHGVMLVASGLLYWAATRIDADTGGRIGPAAWPKAIIVVLGVLCAWEIVKRLVAGSTPAARGLVNALSHNPAEVAAGIGPRAALGPDAEHPRKLAGGIALIAAYVVAAPWTGFFVATALFLAIFPWAGGLRRPMLAALLGLSGSLVLIVVFMRIAYISLPLGEGPFRALSLALLRAIGVT